MVTRAGSGAVLTCSLPSLAGMADHGESESRSSQAHRSRPQRLVPVGPTNAEDGLALYRAPGRICGWAAQLQQTRVDRLKE